MTRDEIIDAVTKLRARREAIPELRDYKPQTKASSARAKAKAPTEPRDPTVGFGDLFKSDPEAE